jgi:hypothetical protein
MQLHQSVPTYRKGNNILVQTLSIYPKTLNFSLSLLKEILSHQLENFVLSFSYHHSFFCLSCVLSPSLGITKEIVS